MVSLSVNKNWLAERTGLNEAQLLEALPQIKVSVVASEGDVLELEVTQDRPDLLGRQGIARALLGFAGKEAGAPRMRLHKTNYLVRVDESVLPVRPIIVCALARGLSLDEDAVAELMQVQEKLTLSHGRRRRKVAIGIHDAEPIRFPLTYKAVAPEGVAFVPLNETRKMSLREIVERTEKGREYAFALGGAKRYPLIFEASGEVISFPPIINSRLTTVTEKTQDLFLDITGTDFEACNVALNILCQNYADDGARIYSVTIVQPSRERKKRFEKIVCPQVALQRETLRVNSCNKLLGLELRASEIVSCLRKQRIDARIAGSKIVCGIPRYRNDVLHEVDLIEEVALGYGYNRFKPLKPTIFTRGRLSEETALVEKARDCLVGNGFIEVATYILTNKEKTARALAAGNLVRIRNPVSTEYSALRNALLPSLLEVLGENTRHAYPQRLFEVGEVITHDASTETRTRTDVHACALSAHSQASASEAASTLAVLMQSLGKRFELRAARLRQFIEGRCVEVFVEGERVGVAGELHPLALKNFGVEMPVAGFEIVLRKGEK